MKIAFIITYHYSEQRQTGIGNLMNLLKNLCESINNTYENVIYIMDNSSSTKLDISKCPQINNVEYRYHYIVDQSIGGLTWAWNYGIKLAINEKSDILINLNDDLSVDNSINSFIECIKNHPNNGHSLFGPVTNSGGAPEHQVIISSCETLETTGLSYGDEERQKLFQGYPLNGFAMGFTKEMYEKFQVDGWLFSRDIRDTWGCQEDEFYLRNKPLGLKNYIVNSCYIKHAKEHSWKKARKCYNHPRRLTLNYDTELEKAPCY